MLPTPNFQLAAAIEAQNAFSKQAHERQREVAEQQKLELENKYYGPSKEADIFKTNQEAQFMPLEKAIQAQNSLRLSGPLAELNEYRNFLNAMPANMRSIYLTNPENKQYHDKMMNLMKSGAGFGTQVLTPQYVKSFFPEAQMNGNPFTQEAQQLPQGAPNPMQELPLTPGMKNKLMQAAEQVNGYKQQAGMQPASQPAQQSIAQQAPAQLPPAERDQLANQSFLNGKQVGQKITQRAIGAVTLDKQLLNNRDEYAGRIQNAAEYAGAKGKGKLALDRLMQRNPNARTDFDFVMSSLIPNISQNVKVMEGLASSDKQREELRSTADKALQSWTNNPESSVMLMNKMMKLMFNQSKATLEAAQPIYPGALEKLYNIQYPEGDYIPQGKSAANKSDEMINIISAKGQHWKIPLSKWKEAELRGASRAP